MLRWFRMTISKLTKMTKRNLWIDTTYELVYLSLLFCCGVLLVDFIQDAQFPSFAQHIDGLVQERRNSTADALELRLSYTSPSIYFPILKTWLYPIWQLPHPPSVIKHLVIPLSTWIHSRLPWGHLVSGVYIIHPSGKCLERTQTYQNHIIV